MQTIKISTAADKIPPLFDDNMQTRLEGSTTRVVFLFFLEMIWALQLLFSAVFAMYVKARVIAAYEKVLLKMDLLIYQSKAKFNEENFQILNLIQQQPSFKVIFFQYDKELRKERMNKFDGVTRSI